MSPSSPVFVGTQLILVANFVDEDGAAFDPATVTATILLPDLTTEDLTVTKESVGQYAAPYTPATAGFYQWRFEAGSPAPVAIEDSFIATTEFPEA